MILYQLAKWMEERTGLHRRILESSEDPAPLLFEKEKIDGQLLAHANQWLDDESYQLSYDNEEST